LEDGGSHSNGVQSFELSVGEARRRNDHTEQRAKFYDLLRARSGRTDMTVFVMLLRQRQRRAHGLERLAFFEDRPSGHDHRTDRFLESRGGANSHKI